MSLLKVNNVTDLGDDAVITDGALVGAGKILQVVQVVKTDTFATSGTFTFQDITGLAASITPTSTSSKILVTLSMHGRLSSAGVSFMKLLRGATEIALGDSAGSRTRATMSNYHAGLTGFNYEFTYLDSPATVSSTTYKAQVTQTRFMSTGELRILIVLVLVGRQALLLLWK